MPKFILGLLLVLVAFPFISSAQAPNCVSYYNGLSAKTPPWSPVYVNPPAGCTGPLKTPIQQNPDGQCNWGYYPGAAPRPASATASKWIAAENRSQIWFYEKDEFNTPGSYAVNWGTCDLKLEWSGPGYACNKTNPLMPKCEYRTTGYGNTSQAQCTDSCKPDSLYSATITHRKFGQTEQKKAYQVGDKIEFRGWTDAGGLNNRYSWKFGDNMWTSGTSPWPDPVIYKTPGIKKVTMNVTNATGQSYIATSTEVKIKCIPPDGATNDFLVAVDHLENNLPVKIAASSFRQWATDNDHVFRKYLVYNQTCENVGELEMSSSAPLVLDYLNKYAGKNKASPLVFAWITTDLLKSGYHAVVALDFKNTNGLNGSLAEYKLKFLDPGGPKITTLTCRQTQQQIEPGKFIKVITCIDPKGAVLMLLNPLTSLAHIPDIDGLISQAIRTNTPSFLTSDYPLIDNNDAIFAGGVCAAWSDFALRVAYRAEFVGECKILPATASVGLTDLSNLLLKLREFLNGQLPLLQR